MDRRSFITDPESFFGARKESPSLLAPALIVIATAVLAAVAIQPFAEFTSQIGQKVFEEGAGTFTPPTAEGTATAPQVDPEAVGGFVGAVAKGAMTVFAFFGPLVGWVLYSLLFYAVANYALDGTGSLGGTFAFVGWGFVPEALTKIANAIANYVVYGGVAVPETQAEAQALQSSLQTDPLLLGATVFGFIMFLWSGVLWTIAMEKLHDLNRQNGFIAIAIPFLIMLALRLQDILAFL
ncbi:Yip1 family protein [Halocatena halophila]|uniref:Yip1 family protein n=1 Tax=Halocatena halophila TaxID=2814576 RepID=UPI002ED1532E